jgi:hypothetical protein
LLFALPDTLGSNSSGILVFTAATEPGELLTANRDLIVTKERPAKARDESFENLARDRDALVVKAEWRRWVSHEPATSDLAREDAAELPSIDARTTLGP